MYCPKCACEYMGWKDRCPACKSVLLEKRPELPAADTEPVEYAALVDAVREADGELTIDLEATEIETKRGREFPYIGRGYAWTAQMAGENAGFAAQLKTTEVGRDRTYTFPYFGFGYAWEQEMAGEINGNSLALIADKVIREQKMGFPYAGYGRAWVGSMSGKCGDQLQAHLKVTEVQQRKKISFPYFGFGYAWTNACKLTLTLANQEI